MELGYVSIGLSILGSIITSAIMFGGMRSDLHNMRALLNNLADQQNRHLQFHLEKKD